jgi:hypothetical protein
MRPDRSDWLIWHPWASFFAMNDSDRSLLTERYRVLTERFDELWNGNVPDSTAEKDELAKALQEIEYQLFPAES